MVHTVIVRSTKDQVNGTVAEDHRARRAWISKTIRIHVTSATWVEQKI